MVENYMSTTVRVLAAVVVMVYLIIGFGYLWGALHHTVQYDCVIAEISPDFPIEVKEKCRNLKSGRI